MTFRHTRATTLPLLLLAAERSALPKLAIVCKKPAIALYDICHTANLACNIRSNHYSFLIFYSAQVTNGNVVILAMIMLRFFAQRECVRMSNKPCFYRHLRPF